MFFQIFFIILRQYNNNTNKIKEKRTCDINAYNNKVIQQDEKNGGGGYRNKYIS